MSRSFSSWSLLLNSRGFNDRSLIMHCIIVMTTVLFLVIVNPFPYDSIESVSGFIDGTLIPRDISTPEDSVEDFTDAGESQPGSVDLQSTGTSMSGLQTDSFSPDAQEEAVRPCEPDGPDKVSENMMMRRDLGPCASWPSDVPDPGKLIPADPHHMPPSEVPPPVKWPFESPDPDILSPGNPHHMPPVDVPPAKDWPLVEPSPSEDINPAPHRMPDESDPEHPLVILEDGDNQKCRGRTRTVCCWGPAHLPEVLRCILCTLCFDLAAERHTHFFYVDMKSHRNLPRTKIRLILI